MKAARTHKQAASEGLAKHLQEGHLEFGDVHTLHISMTANDFFFFKKVITSLLHLNYFFKLLLSVPQRRQMVRFVLHSLALVAFQMS